MSSLFRHLLASLLLLVLALPAAGEGAAVQPESEERFQSEIRPILSRNCLACHGADSRQSGLVLESVADILRGGALSGPAVLVGQSSASPLIQYLKGEKEPRMPLTGSPLPEADIAAISQWIDEMQVAAGGAAKEASLSWPWTPLAEPPLPEVRNRSWVRNEVDAFILAKLEEEGMVPAPPASDRARLRRIYFGLIGLPPTPEEAEGFLGDPSSEAYRLEIERLLSRPEYGVRWGRHWLDLVRYADTGGESTDDARTHLWRYRDYVIRAFNQDRPYDRFIKEQIAGDAYRHYGDEAKLGTGFLYQWIPVQRDRGPERRRDVLNDVVGTTGSVFLGMTLGCARCHDHKYDPLPTRDYYRMEAFFAPLLLKAAPVPFTEFELARRQPELWQEKAAAWDGILASRKALGDRKKAEFKARMRAHRPPVMAQDLKDWSLDITDTDLRWAMKQGVLFSKEEQDLYRLLGKHSTRFANPNNPGYFKPMAFMASDSPIRHSVSTYVLKGGNYLLRGEEVQPGFLSAVTGHSDPVNLEGLSSRRKVLAEWIASPDNPLTARVMVNRIWQYHFGTGLVPQPSDLGKNGGGTRHPELIDWLASKFIRSGWSVKSIQRLILQSNTYQQALRHPRWESYQQTDSDNRYLWKRSPIRLEAEVIRDSLLAVSGELNPLQGGPPFFPSIDREVMDRAGTWWEPSPVGERNRRTAYMLQCRSLQSPMISAFDGPNIQETCPVRGVTTVTPQVFALFNSDFSHQQSQAMAGRIVREVGKDPERQIERAFRLALQRPPSPAERQKCLSFLGGGRNLPDASRELTLKAISFAGGAGVEQKAPSQEGSRKYSLASLCLVLFNMNEFVFLE